MDMNSFSWTIIFLPTSLIAFCCRVAGTDPQDAAQPKDVVRTIRNAGEVVLEFGRL